MRVLAVPLLPRHYDTSQTILLTPSMLEVEGLLPTSKPKITRFQIRSLIYLKVSRDTQANRLDHNGDHAPVNRASMTSSQKVSIFFVSLDIDMACRRRRLRSSSSRCWKPTSPRREPPQFPILRATVKGEYASAWRNVVFDLSYFSGKRVAKCLNGVPI